MVNEMDEAEWMLIGLSAFAIFGIVMIGMNSGWDPIISWGMDLLPMFGIITLVSFLLYVIVSKQTPTKRDGVGTPRRNEE